MNISIIEFIAYASFSLGYAMGKHIINKCERWEAGSNFKRKDPTRSKEGADGE